MMRTPSNNFYKRVGLLVVAVGLPSSNFRNKNKVLLLCVLCEGEDVCDCCDVVLMFLRIVFVVLHTHIHDIEVEKNSVCFYAPPQKGLFLCLDTCIFNWLAVS
jgi:hypothetical protein